MTDTDTGIRRFTGKLSPLVAPTLSVLLAIPLVTLARGCVTDDKPYVLIVGHEAPAASPLALGSGAGDGVLLTEPRVEERHGELVDAGEGAWHYLHRTNRASADFQNPGSLGSWKTPPGGPRHALPAGVDTVVLSGVPMDESGDEPCDPLRQEGFVRHVLRPVDSARVAIRVDGLEVGVVQVPLVRDRPVELGTSAVVVCGDALDLRVGECGSGVLLPAPASLLSVRPSWVEVDEPTPGAFGRAGERVELARVDGTVLVGEAAGLGRSHLVVDDGRGERVVAVHDRRQPVVLEDPLGEAPSLAVARKKAGGSVELLATPRPGTRVVRCEAAGGGLFGGDDGGFVGKEMGRARIESDGLLIAGTSRYAITRDVPRPWGPGGQSIAMTRLEPVERPENFHVLTSLSAGRLLQRRGGFTVPECGSDESSWVVVKARAPRSTDAERPRAADAEPLEEPARIRVDQRVDPTDGAALRQTSVELPVASWALAASERDDDGVPVLQLCATGTGIRSLPLIAAGSQGALGAVLVGGDVEYTTGGWTKHGWGDRIAVGGQVLELRPSLALYERTVPLVLLWVILGFCFFRMVGQVDDLRRRIRRGRGMRAAGLMLLSIPAIVFLLLIGCLLMGRMAAHPELLANPDFLHRTWFSAVIAGFALPACLAFFVEGGSDLLDGQRVRPAVLGLAAAAREFGVALLAVAAAGVIDAILWWALGGRPPLDPIRFQVWKTIVLLAVLGGLMLLVVPRVVPRLFDRFEEPARARLRRAWQWVKQPRGSGAGGLAGGRQQAWVRRSLQGASGGPSTRLSGPAVVWESFVEHPWVSTIFGDRARDLAVIVAAPALLAIGTVIAVLGGGAAHNNIEFGFGLGLKPADLLIIVVGMAVVVSLVRHWARDDEPGEAREPAAGAGMERLRNQVTGGRDVPSGRGAWGWVLRVGLGGGSAAAILVAWGLGILPMVTALVAAALALALALAPPGWMLLGFAIVAVRYGVHVAVAAASLGGWALGVIDLWVVVPALVGVGIVELLIRKQPHLASLLAVMGLLVVLTVLTFAAQGDFGPLMVTVPAIVATGAYWAIGRPKEPGSKPGRRLLAVGALLALLLPIMLAGVALASNLADQMADFQRASDRLLIWIEPWYALGADWSVKGRWIAAGAFSGERAVWVANLHSDLAWIAVMRSYGWMVALGLLTAYVVVCVSLLAAAEETLAKARQMSSKDARRHWVRGAALFAAFASFYLAAEVFVHIATCFTWIPPTGLTLPWISNGGSAALGYALLVGVAIGAVLVAHREAAEDAGGVR